MNYSKCTVLLFCGLLFTLQTFAQSDINIKVMNATHLADHQVAIAIKSPGEANPLIVEVVALGKFRDYQNVSIPSAEQIYLFVAPASASLNKLSPVPDTYKIYPLGMDGVKGCNIVVSGEALDDIHFNMTNIQW